MEKVKIYLKNFFQIASTHEMRILPGNLAFFLMLSVMPLITLVGIICSTLPISVIDVSNMLNDFLPKGIVSVLEPFFTASSDTSHLIILLIIGFVVASNGAHAIILASNTLYKTEGRNYLFRRIKAFLLTIILMLMFVFALVVLAFGNIILKFILSLEVFSYISFDIYSLFVLLKWPTAFIIMFCLIKAMYTMAPDRKVSSMYVNKGALFTTVGWLLVTAIYAFYANNIADYNRFYGGLSNIAMLMIWIYLISYVFVLGIAINTSYYGFELEKEGIKKID